MAINCFFGSTFQNCFTIQLKIVKLSTVRWEDVWKQGRGELWNSMAFLSSHNIVNEAKDKT